MQKFVEHGWTFDAAKYKPVITKFLASHTSVRGNLAEMAKKHDIDLSLLTRMAKGEIEPSVHYLHKLISRVIMSVDDFITREELEKLDKDERSFWISMKTAQNKEYTYFLQEACLKGKFDKVIDALKKIVME